jgi:3-deoxy-D-manno-octulosonic-acid transferase
VSYLLNLIYALLLLLLSPLIAYAAWRKGKYREGFADKFLGSAPVRDGRGRCVWLHAVSVGEVNVLAPLVAGLQARFPDCQCFVSTTTKTGYDLARRRYAELPVFYCPLDFSWAVRRAIRRVRPDVLVLAELELWPNLIRAAGEQGARVAVINGRLSDNSFRGYRRIRSLVASVLRRLDLVAAQNETYADRFRALGARADAVHNTGSLKYDGAQTDRDNPQTQSLAQAAGFHRDDIVFLAGSTGSPEERLALAAFLALAPSHPRLRLVLVPRHPDRFDEVAAMLRDRQVTFQRRSELDHDGANPADRVLLVDAIGELGGWWGTAHIALVGGSLTGRGGQNMIEPAAYGAAVSFGPNTWNFREIVAALLAADGAEVIHNGDELTAFVRRCLTDPVYAARLGSAAQALVRSQLGATDRTLDLLAALLPTVEGAGTIRPAA